MVTYHFEHLLKISTADFVHEVFHVILGKIKKDITVQTNFPVLMFSTNIKWS